MPQNEHENSNNDGHVTNSSQNYSILQVLYFIFGSTMNNYYHLSVNIIVLINYKIILQMLNNAQGPQNYMVNQGQNPAGMYFYFKKISFKSYNCNWFGPIEVLD